MPTGDTNKMKTLRQITYNDAMKCSNFDSKHVSKFDKRAYSEAAGSVRHKYPGPFVYLETARCDWK